MSTTTAERPRTLTEALDRISALEAAGDPQALKTEISRLNSVLISRDAEIKALKAAGSSQQNTPATSQAPVNPPADERPLADMSKRELSEALDTAHANGDKKLVAKIWSEYSSR